MKFSTLITVWTALLGIGAVVAIGASTPSKPLQSQQPTKAAQPTREISVQEIKSRAMSVPWDQLARDPRNHKGTIVVLRGKVVQSLEHGSSYVLRVDVAPDEIKFPSDIVYVEYRKRSPSETRILEGDQVQFWGEYVGIYSYTAVLGQTIQIPHVVAQIVEDQGRYVRPASAPPQLSPPPKLKLPNTR
jgi:hypothetical protein